MRLICPGCAAQYEVTANAIPPEGRDVQCSNCGQTWFQRGPLPDGTLPQDRDEVILAKAAQGVPSASVDPEAPPLEQPGDPIDDVPETDPMPDPAPARQTAPDALPEADAPPLRVRKIDDAVLSVLREEAQREARARRAEAGNLETQPDLGLALQPQATPRRPTERPARIATPVAGTDIAELRARRAALAQRDDRLSPDSDMAEVDDAANTRRNRLPDIEEINSTLRGASEREGRAAPLADATREERNTRRGFRLGFLSVVVLGVVAVIVYVLAAPIADAIPALEPALAGYAAAMDALRLWVSAQSEAAMRALLAWIS